MELCYEESLEDGLPSLIFSLLACPVPCIKLGLQIVLPVDLFQRQRLLGLVVQSFCHKLVSRSLW